MNENPIVVGTRSGVLRCAKCNTPVVLMKGDYIFGFGYDCPKCEEARS
jgi:phage FluMu protein Com